MVWKKSQLILYLPFHKQIWTEMCSWDSLMDLAQDIVEKNLYGLWNVLYNWFQKIVDGLESEGFFRLEIDQCMFLRKKCIVLMYVDSIIALSRENDVLVNLIEILRQKNYILEDEESLTKYLGIDVKHKAEGHVELVQQFLIQQAMDLLELKSESTYGTKPSPATK